VEDGMRQVVEGAIVRSPFGRLLGLELQDLGPGRVRVRMPYGVERTTIGDMVHGGAIAGLVDVAATGAVWSDVDDPRSHRGTTIGFSVSFLAAARSQALVAEARVLRRGSSVAFVEVTVLDEQDEAVARASVTYKLSRATPSGPA
jgi:uncharacterized protein (TIGR00369 family)